MAEQHEIIPAESFRALTGTGQLHWHEQPPGQFCRTEYDRSLLPSMTMQVIDRWPAAQFPAGGNRKRSLIVDISSDLFSALCLAWQPVSASLISALAPG